MSKKVLFRFSTIARQFSLAAHWWRITCPGTFTWSVLPCKTSRKRTLSACCGARLFPSLPTTRWTWAHFAGNNKVDRRSSFKYSPTIQCIIWSYCTERALSTTASGVTLNYLQPVVGLVTLMFVFKVVTLKGNTLTTGCGVSCSFY